MARINYGGRLGGGRRIGPVVEPQSRKSGAHGMAEQAEKPVALNLRALRDGRDQFSNDRLLIITVAPAGVIALEFTHIADPPDVVSAARLRVECPLQAPARQLL